MKWSILAAVVVGVLADPTPARAQFVIGPVPGPAYRSSFTFGGGIGFSRASNRSWVGGFAGGYSRTVFAAPYGGFGPGFGGWYSTFPVGGCYPRWPLAPVMPAISPITTFGFGPGFLGPGWGVGPTFGWNPVWGGAMGWFGPPFWGGWGPWARPFPVWAPPPVIPFFATPQIPPAIQLGAELRRPVEDMRPNAPANAAPPGGVAGLPLLPPPGQAVGPAPIGAKPGDFLVIEPRREFPPPGVVAPAAARVEVPAPPLRPAFRFDPFADKALVNVEKGEPDPVKEAARLVKLGREAFATGEYGLAAEHFDRAARANPKASEAHFLKAQSAFAFGGYADAVAAIRAGLALDPAWPAGAFDPKEPYGENVRAFAAHLADLRKAVAANPGQPTLEFLLGYELWFIGEQVEAKRWFAAAEKRLGAPGPIALFK